MPRKPVGRRPKRIPQADDWEPFQEPRKFSEADIDAIIEAAGGLPDGLVTVERFDEAKERNVRRRMPRKQALWEQLEAAAQVLDYAAEKATKPVPSEMAKRFKAIESAAKDLLDALGYDPLAENRMSNPIFYGLSGQAQHNGAKRKKGYADIWPDLVPRNWNLGHGNAYVDYWARAAVDRTARALPVLRLWARSARCRARKEVGTAARRQPAALQSFVDEFCWAWLRCIGPVQTSVTPSGQVGGPLIRALTVALKALGVRTKPAGLRARILATDAYNMSKPRRQKS